MPLDIMFIPSDPGNPRVRAREHLERVALILNSLLRTGQIIQISATEFVINASVPPPIPEPADVGYTDGAPIGYTDGSTLGAESVGVL